MTDQFPKNPSAKDPDGSVSTRAMDRMLQLTIEARGIRDPRILAALRRVPRHAFVPPEYAASAYEDAPLPVGNGQTISQPYIVALMTEAAGPAATDRCLEIGTGSGYQTAVLAQLAREVYSIECIEALAGQARRNLESSGLMTETIHLRQGDGFFGWAEAAPFDVVLITAAPPSIPPPLLEQLAVGGRLVAPVGPERSLQQLERWTRRSAGNGPNAFEVTTLLDVRFVPMVGAAQDR